MTSRILRGDSSILAARKRHAIAYTCENWQNIVWMTVDYIIVMLKKAFMEGRITQQIIVKIGKREKEK